MNLVKRGYFENVKGKERNIFCKFVSLLFSAFIVRLFVGIFVEKIFINFSIQFGNRL